MPSAAAKVIDQTPELPVIDVARPQADHGVNAALLKIAAATKTNPLKIMRDYVGLAFGPGKVSFKDYVRLRLFDPEFWAGADRRMVAGAHLSGAIYHQINYRYDWWGLLENKIAADGYLATYGIPTIPLVAIYHADLKTGGALVVPDEQRLREFLTDEANFPLFGKPTEEQQSLGSVGLRRYLPQERSLETHDGSVTLDAFVEQLRTHYAKGYLFQKLVSPHTAMRAVCGDRLATVRIITIVDKGGPKVFRACWKIPAGGNAADNYWRRGNLLAQLDIAEGKVLRVLSGSGLELQQFDRHPDSGAALIGFQIPHWRRLVDIVLEAARLMHHVPLIGWDVAVLDDGPAVVEMNERPDFMLPQLADSRGIMEPELTELMAVQQEKFAEHKKANRRVFKEL